MSLLQSFEDPEARLDEALDQDPAGLPGAVLAEAVARQVRIRNKLAALDAGGGGVRRAEGVDGQRSPLGGGVAGVGRS